MLVCKDVEVEVDVDIEDFDIRDITDYIVKLNNSKTKTIYEGQVITELVRNLGSQINADTIYSMSREDFAELFDIMKNSWQNLT